jgi:ribosomal protein S18 acetylase RimI-like enzyme
MMIIREFTLNDYTLVIDLWKKAGIELSNSDSLEGIKHKLERDSDLFLVAEKDGRIVSAVMGSYDGRRGWVNHLAVDPQFQGNNVGTEIMVELEKRFKDVGCEKVNLLIEMDNSKVQGFYEKLGFNHDKLIFMEKWVK